MGRTVTPYSQVFADHQERLAKFRRALRDEDQRAMDALYEKVRLHVQAGVYAAAPDPGEAIFLSMLIETWKTVDVMQARIEQLEKQLRDAGQRVIPLPKKGTLSVDEAQGD